MMVHTIERNTWPHSLVRQARATAADHEPPCMIIHPDDRHMGTPSTHPSATPRPPSEGANHDHPHR
jgi:hypothetical protein